MDFENLYVQEQTLLMHCLKVFGEMSKTPRMVEVHMTSGLTSLLLRVLEDE